MTQQQRKGQTGEPTKNPGEFGSARHDESDISLTITGSAPSVADRAAARLDAAEDVLPLRYSEGRQSYDLQQVVALPAVGDIPEQKVRVHFRNDSYADQSFVRTDLMTAEGWTRIDNLDGQTVHARTPSRYKNMDTNDRIGQCQDVIHEQLRTAARLLS
jgi:hypothetical protein